MVQRKNTFTTMYISLHSGSMAKYIYILARVPGHYTLTVKPEGGIRVYSTCKNTQAKPYNFSQDSSHMNR